MKHEHQTATEVIDPVCGMSIAVRTGYSHNANIRRNLFFAFVYNSTGVPIAAGVLFPFFGLVLRPMIASTAMTFSSVSVILNAAG